jgi:hypothetical protein
MWRQFLGSFVCLFKGHDWHFAGNRYARAAGAERCDRCGRRWVEAHDDHVSTD